MSKVETKIKLGGMKVIFANLVDEGFGKSITVDVTDEKYQKAIAEWVKANNIGKGANAGKPNFKEYTKDGNTTVQYSFKINDNTRFAGLNGLTEANLGYGATIALIAQAFDYDNKFGKGTSASLSAVVVERGATTGADADLSELLSEEGEQPTQDVVLEDIEEEIDLKDIPF